MCLERGTVYPSFFVHTGCLVEDCESVILVSMGKSARSCLLMLAVLCTADDFLEDEKVYALESPQAVGFYCGADAPITDGQFYAPPSSTCTYLSASITDARYGDLYRGTVGSSTILNGHFLSSQATSTQFGDAIPNPQEGEDIFAAIFPANFLTEFRSFFQTGAGAPVGTNYGFIRFKYGSPPSAAPDPVIIIPGILGSEEHDGVWEIDPILHTYDDLIATLDANGYTPAKVPPTHIGLKPRWLKQRQHI